MLPMWRHKMWTERDQGGDDPYGGGENWQPHLDAHECSWWSSSGREQVSDDRSVVLVGENVIAPLGTDVRPGDRVVKVETDDGVPVVESPRWRTIEHVDQHPSLLDCSLKAVT